VAIDPDYNNYDSFHATFPHPRMSHEEWTRAFRDAWREFYSFEHMRRTLLAQNPGTYWPMLKNLIWCRASMIEGAHPMITGFFRLKERRSRRPGLPIEPRYRFFKRRVREFRHILAGYLRLGIEMQELWLLTRIRREDYWFLGDLRRLGPRSLQACKLTWRRLHAAMAPALASAQQRLETAAIAASATMHARLDALRQAKCETADDVHAAGFGPLRARFNAMVGAVGKGRSEPAATWHSRLADLRLPELPPVRLPSAFRRRLRRLNPFSIEPLEHDPRLTAYWRRTREKVARFQLWRLNPLSLTWNLARGTRRALIFFMALQREWY